MNFVFVSYNYNEDFDAPDDWFERIKFYTGALECLSLGNNVHRVEQINYRGDCEHNQIYYHFINQKIGREHFPVRLHQKVKKLHPDIVIVHGLHFPLQVIQLRLYLNSTTNIIAQNHAERPAQGLKKILQKLADRFIQGYWFASKAMGDSWVTNGNLKSKDKIYEVMEVSSPFFQTDKNLARVITGVEGEFIYLWVGRLNENKDPLNVVHTFLKFIQTQPNAVLYMVYHTEELLAEIKASLIINSQAASSIKLIGKVPHEDLLYWYNSADFFISGSFHEGSGTAVCEAMSCGCVPIVTDIDAFRAITNSGNCGVLYEPGNSQSLLDVLKESVCMDIKGKKKMSLDFFDKNLSFKAIAEKMESIAARL